MAVINVPKVLRERLTEEGAESLVKMLDQLEAAGRRGVLELAEGRFEKRLAQVETRLVQWMFVFWAGQIGVLTGILFAFFR